MDTKDQSIIMDTGDKANMMDADNTNMAVTEDSASTALSPIIPTTLPHTFTIDFSTLALQSRSFSNLWTNSNHHLNFQNPQTQLTLTTSILSTSFSLNLTLPPSRLCPPVPNRVAYISFIQSLIDTTSPTYSNSYDPNRVVTGLDIGTGASAIYTLIALRSRPNWHMCATDIDDISFLSARSNLTQNKLIDRTKLLQTTPSSPLFPLSALKQETLDFTLCNPPFFNSVTEWHSSIAGSSGGKTQVQNSVCTGSESEMVFSPSGDLGFVKRMVEESLVLRERVSWYTSLFGKLSSMREIVYLLRDTHGINNYCVHSLDPSRSGGTKRWIVAWSFGDRRPANWVVRGEGVQQELLAFPTEAKFKAVGGEAVARERIGVQLGKLDMRWESDEGELAIGVSNGNVWNRNYRRGKGKQDDGGQKPPEFAFRIKFGTEEVTLQWLRGNDVTMWESFCGLVKRTLG